MKFSKNNLGCFLAGLTLLVWSGPTWAQIFDDAPKAAPTSPATPKADPAQGQAATKANQPGDPTQGNVPTAQQKSDNQNGAQEQYADDIIDDDPTQNDPPAVKPQAKPKPKVKSPAVKRTKRRTYRRKTTYGSNPKPAVGQKKSQPIKLEKAVQKLGADILEWQRQKNAARKKIQTQPTQQFGPTPPTPPTSPSVNVRGENSQPAQTDPGNSATDVNSSTSPSGQPSPPATEPTTGPPPETAGGQQQEADPREGGFRLPVTITLGSSQNLEGYMEKIPSGKLSITHRHKGLVFKKQFRWQDIERINILKWASTKIRDTAQGTLYAYRPAKIQVHLKNGEVLFFDNMPQPLMEFHFVHNGYGKTRLFTHFADVQLKDGRWRERQDRIDPETTPHPQAVTKILFAQ